jgi:hypothetical protein
MQRNFINASARNQYFVAALHQKQHGLALFDAHFRERLGEPVDMRFMSPNVKMFSSPCSFLSRSLPFVWNEAGVFVHDS